MNDILEKFKTMDNSQKMLVIGAIVCILTLPLFLISGDDDNFEGNFESLETPENRNEVEDYNSKLEAYEAARSEKENVSLDFNIDDYKNQDVSEEESLEKEIDSLMNENKRQYSEPVGQTRGQTSRSTASSGGHRPSTSKHTIDKTQRKENINSEFESFFTSSPESQNPTTSAASKTDAFIYAVIHGDHTIKQGERVKLRLTKPATIAGMDFPQNSYVYAFPTFQNNRVLLDINSINHVAVSISAYDTEDSAIGLYVKGAKMVGEITDESSKDAVDDVDVGGVPLGSTIKNVFKKKQETPTVTLLNNTKLILKPNS
ncbi:conjugative transposon protein TraM [Flagellimonas beolgyonensis]|uniref:conjugative transposon protein TraM n=1 Tax=Flagellimonas beolgyonensis TaxID=864064 RepID=UPI000F8C4A3F|nr:conjugative transposon protein TraM [Allomuricauda beolgyonensis]